MELVKGAKQNSKMTNHPKIYRFILFYQKWIFCVCVWCTFLLATKFKLCCLLFVFFFSWHAHRLSRIFYKSFLKSKNYCWHWRLYYGDEMVPIEPTLSGLFSYAVDPSDTFFFVLFLQIFQIFLDIVCLFVFFFFYAARCTKYGISSPWNPFKPNWMINIKIWKCR